MQITVYAKLEYAY